MKHHYVYSPDYDFYIPGVSQLHPFDGRKYSKAWRVLTDSCSIDLEKDWTRPTTPVEDATLLKVHSQQYLDSLNHSRTIAQVIEVPLARFIPNGILQNRFLRPVRLACQGTLIATEYALNNNAVVMNIGGGFHHAYADHGEGFSFFGDAALAIKIAQENGLLAEKDKVLMIDLDAHRGNGFEAMTHDNPNVHILDMYNFQVYPGMHYGDMDDYPFMIPLRANMTGPEYLDILRQELPTFLGKYADAKLVFYNAGTDIYENDNLGRLRVSFEDVLERDRYVLEQITSHNLPCVITTSGGYTSRSYEMVAELAKSIFNL